MYDGVCNLCVGVVRLLNALDRKHEFEFAPYQSLGSEERKKYGLSIIELQGRMHIIRQDDSLAKGAVALAEACKALSPIISVCEVFNIPLAQKFYDFIARRRYRFFGCRDSCYSLIETRSG